MTTKKSIFRHKYAYKKECALAHSRAEARLLQQPSTFAPSAHPCGALFCFIGRNFLRNKKRPSSLRRRPFSCCSLLISAAVIHIVPAAVVCFIPAAILRLVLPGIPAAVLAGIAAGIPGTVLLRIHRVRSMAVSAIVHIIVMVSHDRYLLFEL